MSSSSPVESVDGTDGAYRTAHDMATDGLTLTVSVALAAVTDTPQTEVISEFATYADPDALNRLFRERLDGEHRTPASLTLSVEDYEVTIHSDGEIRLDPV